MHVLLRRRLLTRRTGDCHCRDRTCPRRWRRTSPQSTSPLGAPRRRATPSPRTVLLPNTSRPSSLLSTSRSAETGAQNHLWFFPLYPETYWRSVLQGRCSEHIPKFRLPRDMWRHRARQPDIRQCMVRDQLRSRIHDRCGAHRNARTNWDEYCHRHYDCVRFSAHHSAPTKSVEWDTQDREECRCAGADRRDAWSPFARMSRDAKRQASSLEGVVLAFVSPGRAEHEHCYDVGWTLDNFDDCAYGSLTAALLLTKDAFLTIVPAVYLTICTAAPVFLI